MKMSRDELISALKEISEMVGDRDDVLEKLTLISDGYEEVKYNDGDVYDSDGVRWSEKYDDIRRRYRDRFFSTGEIVKEEQFEDIAKDDESTVEKFDDLFEEREGDYK